MPRTHHGFPAIVRDDARVLILGSMPSRRSLDLGQYYGHPRNRFWPLMGKLFGAGPELNYLDRCAALTHKQIAVWDVLASCQREGSLDSAIDANSLVPNDFAAFLSGVPALHGVFFNGAAAQACFERHVRPGLGEHLKAVAIERLPSTSPANAAYSFERLLGHWRAVADALG